MLITRTNSSHFCSTTFSKPLVGSRLHAEGHPLPVLILLSARSHVPRTKRSSRRGLLPAQLCWQAAHHAPAWAPVWGHLDLYGLGGSSPPRPAVSLSSMGEADPDIISWLPSIAQKKGQEGAKPACQPWSSVHPDHREESRHSTGPALPLTLTLLMPVCWTGKGCIATVQCLQLSAHPCYWSSSQETQPDRKA